jgi:hypothetical protein
LRGNESADDAVDVVYRDVDLGDREGGIACHYGADSVETGEV